MACHATWCNVQYKVPPLKKWFTNPMKTYQHLLASIMICQHLLTTALFAIDPSYWRYVSQRSYPKRGPQLVWMDAFLMHISPPFSTPVDLVLQLHHLGETFGTLGRWDLVWSGDMWFNVLPLFRNSRLNCVQCFFVGLKHVIKLTKRKIV